MSNTLSLKLTRAHIHVYGSEGALDNINKVYGGLVTSAEAGFNVSLQVDFDALPEDGGSCGGSVQFMQFCTPFNGYGMFVLDFVHKFIYSWERISADGY